ncbi:transposase [Rathayibacter tritici]|nr:transposase [Rathayibacter tritici]AND15938.1 transposase [Rathayibacter tritici]AND16785.1 transposase [Rathayibacter tritici]AND17231.1 transposase [Rathayibacter tritici]AND17489.1 transposase [Rathayibacter tritici]
MEGMTLLAIDRVSREARRRTQEAGAARLVESGVMDDLFAKIDAGEIELEGAGGLIQQLIKSGLERGLQTELTEHVGYEKGDPDAAFHENSRNGSFPKTVATNVGDVELRIPRDRKGTFTPRLVPTGSRRLSQLDEMIVSLYAGGMTVRDIEHHLAATVGTELSRETISKIVDEISDEVLAWQSRPLEAFYPVIYLDALIVKVRDGGHVRNKAAHLAVGVDMDGIKHVLGIWVQQAEGAKFWASVCAELANRGVRDVLIVCCDGLTGFPEAIEATWPDSMVQTCVVHLIRNAVRFVAYGQRKAVAAALKPVYQAPTADAARTALEAFTTSELGRANPHAAAVFESAWERFTPFLAFPPEVRRVIYTTNAIESLNFQLRKVTKNRGHFPNDAAVIKLLWLAICDIEDKRARDRARDRGRPAAERRAEGRLVEGQVVTNWKKALEQLSIAFPERIHRYL